MDCKKVKEKLSSYSVGLIHGKDKARIEEHLTSCADCARELETLERVALLIEEAPSIEPPVGLWNGVYNRINAPDEDKKRIPLRDVFLGALRINITRLSVAAATVALAVILALSHINQPSQEMENAVTNEYIQGHIMYSNSEILVDQTALTSLATLTDREQYGSDIQ